MPRSLGNKARTRASPFTFERAWIGLSLASLAVNLIAQTNRFTQPLKGAERGVQSFARVAERAEQRLQRFSASTQRARVHLLAIQAALGVATKQATDYADSILAVHKQTGLAVESTQALRYAASQSHTDIATLEKGLRSFVRRAAEAAEGNASMAKGFDRLGVDVLDATGQLKDTETLLLEVADGAAQMGTEAEASAALMLVMGDAGRRLVPFMQQGAGGIRGLMDEALDLSIVAEEKVIFALGALGEEAAATGNRLGAVSRDIAYRFSPAIQVGLGWVNRLIDGFFDLSEEQRQQIVRWTAIVAAVLGGVAVIGVLARVLASAVGVMRTFGMVLSFVFSPLVMYSALAIAAIAAFKWAWENDWLGIRTAATTAWDDYIEPIWEALKEAWTWSIKVAGDAWDWLTETTWTEKVEDMKGWLTDGWSWAVDKAGDAWSWITEQDWADHLETAKGWLTDGWKWAIDKAGDAWDWLDEHAPAVTKTLRDMRDVVQSGWKWAIDKGGDAWDFLKDLVPGEVIEFGKARLQLTVEAFGGLYDKIQTGLETGDWSGIWEASADAWREGIKIAVTLALAAGAAKGILWAITSGLGLAGAGMTGLSSLGLPGVIGALSVGVALMEAAEGGDYEAFGANLIAALAAGIGIGAFTGSPAAGALAFTIVLNFQVGEWIGEQADKFLESSFMRWTRGVAGTGPTREAATLLEPQLYGDREAYLQPVPDYSLWQRLQLWLQNQGYEDGTPWTGWGPTNEIAGVVHRREAVIPWTSLQKGPAGVLEFLGVPGFQMGRLPGGMTSVGGFGSGVGFHATGVTAGPNDIGWLRSQFETAMAWIEESISPELANKLRQSFEGLLNVADSLEDELRVMWDAIDSVPDALDDAVAAAREMQEQLEAEAERQERMQRTAQKVNAALSSFAAGLSETHSELASFVSMLKYEAGQGFSLDVDSIISFGANILGEALGAILGGGRQQSTHQRTFDAFDPYKSGMLAEMDRQAELLDELEWWRREAKRLEDEFDKSSPWTSGGILDQLGHAYDQIRQIEKAVEDFDFRQFLGFDAPSIARTVESGFDMADPSSLARSLEDTVRTALVRAWTTSEDMMRLQEQFGDQLDALVTEYMETGDMGNMDDLEATIEEIEKRGDAFADVLDELGLAADQATESIGGMINIPQGFRYALARAEATTAQPAPAGVVASPAATVHPRAPDLYEGAGLSSRGPDKHYHFHGDLYGWDDFKRQVQRADAENTMTGNLAAHGHGGGTQ